MKSINRGFITLTFSFLALTSLHAQHCGYCSASIQVFQIHSENDSQSISGLRVYLLDTFNQVVKTTEFDVEKWDYVEDTFFIYQNPKQTTFKGYIDNVNPMIPHQMRFWFAEDNYVYVPKSETYGAATLVVEDPSSERKGGQYQKMEFDIFETNVFMLCTGASNWDSDPSNRSFVKGFAPQIFALKRK